MRTRMRTRKPLTMLLAVVLAVGMCVPPGLVAEAADLVPDTGSNILASMAPAAEQAADLAHIVSLSGTSNIAVVDGTAPFDANDQRGNDSSASNRRVRSFDTVYYNVDVTAKGNDDRELAQQRMGYEFKIPYDDEVVLVQNAMNWTEDWAETTRTENGTTYRVYTMYRDMPQTAGRAIPGGCTVEFVLKVGAKQEGDRIQPVITSWCEGNATRLEYTPDAATVTTAPKYNVALTQRSLSQVNQYSFDGNEYNPGAGTVQGMLASYGFALQLYNDGDANKGIRGIELPVGPITFDIDLASVYRADGSSVENALTGGFAPLLYAVFANGANGQRCEDLPYSGSAYTNLEGRYCYDSGGVSVVQDGNTLHVTVSDYQIDRDSFPALSANGSTSFALPDGTVEVGNVSVFRIDVVQPTTTATGQDIQATYGDNGTVQVDAEAKNLRATSETGTAVTTDTNPDDNKVSRVNHLNGAGRYDHEVFFSDDVNWTGGTSENPDNKPDGSDSAIIGSKLSFTAIYSEKDVSATNVYAHTVAFDQLLKFDDRALEIDTTRAYRNDEPPTATRAVQYVGKAGGWDHAGLSPWEDGYDAEMKAAKEETASLHYYDSLAELEAAGDTCVGLLVKWRGCNTETAKDNFSQLYQFRLKVRDDADSVAKLLERDGDNLVSTYMLTATTNAWLAGDLDASAVAAYCGTDAANLTVADYARYASDSANEAAITARPHSVDIDRDDDYVKARYDASGYAGGDTGGFLHGDSLYVVPYEARVSKHVAQAGTDGDDKQSYDVDAGQRAVDFVITSALRLAQKVDVASDWTTDVVLTDTIPAGLTYIEGSGVLGGTYTEQTPNAGVVEGGTAITPAVTRNADGSTTLTWTIPGQAVRTGLLPQLHYSCTIGDEDNPENDVHNNQSLVTSVSISTNEDKRTPSVELGNLSTDGITVVKLASFNIAKTGTNAIELDGTGTFDLVVSNSSSNAREGLYAIDFMPRNGVNDTDAAGTYELTGFKLLTEPLATQAGPNLDDIAFYYTDSTDAALIGDGKTAASVPLATITSQWTRATFDQTTGEVTGFSTWPTAIAYVDAELPAMRTAHMVLTYRGNAARPGDSLVNVFAEQELPVSAPAKAYARSISGIAWLDADHDGEMADDEKRLAGLTVTLLTADGSPVYRADGTTRFTTTTDENGFYQFGVSETPTESDEAAIVAELLRSGDYQVAFSGMGDASYVVTGKEASGVDGAKNSKADGVYDNGALSSAVITGVHAQSIAEMQTAGTTYHAIPNLNAGFYASVDIPVTKTWDDAFDQDGLRPDTLTVSLYADGAATGKTLALSGSSNTWEGAFTGLDKYKADGSAIVYTVSEAAVAGYNTDTEGMAAPTGNAADGFAFTNVHEPATVDVQVSKVWADGADADDLRPESVTLTLRKTVSGETSDVPSTDVPGGNPFALTSADAAAGNAATWTKTITGLPKYEGGRLVSYTFAENSVPTGYTAAVSGATVTNTHAVSGSLVLTATKTVSGEKPDASLNGAFQFTLTPADDNPEPALGAQSVQTKTNVTGADGLAYDTVTFDALRFGSADVGKTFSYTMAEVVNTTDAYIADRRTYTITVTPALSADGMRVLANYEVSDASGIPVSVPAFDNQPVPATQLVLAASKTVDGATPTADQEFDFTIQLASGGSVLQTKQNVGGTVTFDALEYTTADVGTTFAYTVQEPNSATGFTRDGTVYTVTVVPRYSDDGTSIVAEPTITRSTDGATVESMLFANATVRTTTQVTKVWANDTGHGFDPRPESVSMQLLKTVNGTTTPVSGKTLTLTADDAVAGDANTWVKSFAADELPAYENGRAITYSFREIGAPAGYTPSYSDDGLTVTNTYTQKANPKQLYFWGIKSVDGAAPATGQAFSFSWYEVDSSGAETFLDHVYSNGADIDLGGWEFGDEDENKTYTFRLREDDDATDGYQKNDTYYDVVVAITRPTAEDLKATVTLKKDGQVIPGYENLEGKSLDWFKTANDNNPIRFDNAPLSASLNLGVKKTVDGEAIPAITNWNSQETSEYWQFGFKLAPENAAAEGKIATAEAVRTPDDSADGRVDFSALTFGPADVGTVFEFSVAEDVASAPQEFVASSSVYRIIVVPRVSTVEGVEAITLDTTVTKDGAALDPADPALGDALHLLSFDNEEIALGVVQFGATKTVNGAEPAADQRFAFALKYQSLLDQNGNPVDVEDQPFTPGDYLDVRTNSTSGMDVDFNGNADPANGTVPLSEIDFEVSDVGYTYVFEVVELTQEGYDAIPAEYYENLPIDSTTGNEVKISDGFAITPGFALDRSVYTVTVTPRLSADGKSVVVEPVYRVNGTTYTGTTPAFDNTTIAPASLSLSAVKTVDGAEPRQREDGLFTFLLVPDSENPDPALGAQAQQVKANAGSAVTFDDLTFAYGDIGKTFTYTVSERIDDAVAYAQDRSVYTVSVTPALAADGTIQLNPAITRTVPDGTESAVDSMAFDNKTIVPASVVLTASKTVDGQPADDGLSGAFSFSLSRVDGTASEVLQVKPNVADAVTFDALEFDWNDAVAGTTFAYEVAEVANHEDDYVDDASVYTVEVAPRIVNDVEGARVVAEPVVTKDGASVAADAISFDNRKVEHGEVRLTATKTVAGAEPSSSQVFRFRLLDETGTVVQTQLNNGSEVVFDPIVFTWEDALEGRARTYTYTIEEDADANGRGYVVDGRTYQVTMTPRIDSANARVVVDVDGADGITFDNTPVAPAVFSLVAAKTVDGAEPTARQVFEFTMSGSDGSVRTAMNDGSTVAFETVPFTWEDVGTAVEFTVTETDGPDNYDYDESVYRVVVTPTLSDDGTGVVLEQVVYLDGQVVDAVAFNNVQTSPDEPDDPDEPGDSDDPDDPEDPDEGDPGDPDGHDDPSAPDGSDDPDGPGASGDPDDPGDSQDDPDDPNGNPESPGNPEKASESSSSAPTAPERARPAASAFAKTGDNLARALQAELIAIASSLLAAGYALHRKRNEHPR